MSINLGSNIRVQTTLPLDAKYTAADDTARDAILAGERYQGMQVFVTATGLTWQLVGGITNSDWTAFGSGGAGTGVLGVAVGTIIAFGGTTAPTNYLKCDGASILRASYPDLLTAIGTAYGTVDATHFNVPDLRGRFLRGTDEAQGRDVSASSRTAIKTGGNTGDNVGSLQDQDMIEHQHLLFRNTVTNTSLSGASETVSYARSAGDAGDKTETVSGSSPANIGISSSQVGSGVGSGSETRPKNVNVTYIIKAIGDGISGGTDTAPTIFGSVASPRSIAYATGIVSASSHMSTTALKQRIFMKSTTAGENHITANPQIEAHTIIGAEMKVVGGDDTNYITLLEGTGLEIFGRWSGKVGNSLALYWNGTVWAEDGRVEQ